MTSVLITGGAGFIGARLCQALTRADYAAVALDSLAPQVHGTSPELDLGDAQLVVGDVRDRAALDPLVETADVVVHLAADTGTGQSMHEMERYVDVNVRGTAVLLDAIARARRRPKRIVLASSRAVYGEGLHRCGEHGHVAPPSRTFERLRVGEFELQCPVCGRDVEPIPTLESAPLQPASIYAVTKMAQERLVAVGSLASGVTSLALRLQNVFGPGQSLRNPYTGVLSVFSTELRHGNRLEVYEDGLESRDFVYVDDVVDALLAGIESDVDAEAINVGTGRPVSILDVAGRLKDVYGSSSEIEISGRFRLGDIRHCFADLARAKAALGFEPHVSFESGIERFAEWVTTQPTTESGLGASIEELEARGLIGRAERAH
jgi:dTDP-L-rhamnose 4-epimerase